MDETIKILGLELMAKFMDITIIQSKTTIGRFYHSDEFTDVNGKLAFPYNLKFNTDWNWLYAVIDKINKLDIIIKTVIDEDLVETKTYNVCFENGMQGIKIAVFEFQMVKEIPIYKTFNAELEDSYKNRLTIGRFLTDKERSFITITKFLEWYYKLN